VRIPLTKSRGTTVRPTSRPRAAQGQRLGQTPPLRAHTHSVYLAARRLTPTDGRLAAYITIEGSQRTLHETCAALQYSCSLRQQRCICRVSGIVGVCPIRRRWCISPKLLLKHVGGKSVVPPPILAYRYIARSYGHQAQYHDRKRLTGSIQGGKTRKLGDPYTRPLRNCTGFRNVITRASNQLSSLEMLLLLKIF